MKQYETMSSTVASIVQAARKRWSYGHDVDSDQSRRVKSEPGTTPKDWLELPDPGPLRPNVKSVKRINLNLHGSATDTYDMGDNIATWLIKYMGFETRLVYFGQQSRLVLGSGAADGDMAYAEHSPLVAPVRRIVPPALKRPTERSTFQDIDQYLVVTTEFNDEVSSRLAEGMETDVT